MRKVLVSWIGSTDLKASKGTGEVGLGPIAQALEVRSFDFVLLVTDYKEAEVAPFLDWLKQRTTTPLEVVYEKLSSPTEYGEIYEAAERACTKVLVGRRAGIALTFHLSPGTPPMAAVWLLLAKTRFPAELIQSSREHGVKTASVPFDIAMDFIPELLRERDARLRQLVGESPEAPEFADIVHRSQVMERLIARARRVAPRNVPVLLEGESGTGKEMLARAIHAGSLRRDAPFIAVNCGAIPAGLVESELFGHEKGAFSGAHQRRKGHFEEAEGGTLFLDEIGELPSQAQVKLLRVLQENEVTRVGASTPISLNVRIVAATNRTLSEEITAGRFREDLFYRLAVAVLKLPPLRERTGDVGLLMDHLLAQVNREAEREPGYRQKKISAAARNLLLNHPWPGNVRELLNTLRRAALWSEGDTISVEDAREALLPLTSSHGQQVLGRPLGEDFDLQGLLGEVAHHYLGRAMDEAHGNKTQAARLLGLSSYQTLTNWLSKYKVDS